MCRGQTLDTLHVTVVDSDYNILKYTYSKSTYKINAFYFNSSTLASDLIYKLLFTSKFYTSLSFLLY